MAAQPCDRLDKGETTHSAGSAGCMAASGYLSVHWLPLVHERWHPCAPNWLASVSSCVARPRPGSLGARRSFVRRWCPRLPSTPVLPCPTSQLGCEVIWLGRATAGEILGGATAVPGELQGAGTRVAGSAAFCARLTSDTRWISICDIRDLPPDIRHSKQHPSEVKTARSLPKSRTSANCQWGDV